MHDEPADPLVLLKRLRAQHRELLQRMQQNQGDFQRLARSSPQGNDSLLIALAAHLRPLLV